jgi:hypothetical protein
MFNTLKIIEFDMRVCSLIGHKSKKDEKEVKEKHAMNSKKFQKKLQKLVSQSTIT